MKTDRRIMYASLVIFPVPHPAPFIRITFSANPSGFLILSSLCDYVILGVFHNILSNLQLMKRCNNKAITLSLVNAFVLEQLLGLVRVCRCQNCVIVLFVKSPSYFNITRDHRLVCE